MFRVQESAPKKGEPLFGTVDTWLIWNLTCGEVHVTDYSNACRTMLFDIDKLQWDPFLCEKLGIPMSMLPEVKPSSRIYGEVAKFRAWIKLRVFPSQARSAISRVHFSAKDASMKGKRKIHTAPVASCLSTRAIKESNRALICSPALLGG